MKRFVGITAVLALMVGLCAADVFATQGRMGGMGDPYGLVNDETDFLIHPSYLADIKAQQIFGDYRFTYRSIDWSWSGSLATNNLFGYTVDSARGKWDSSGDAFEHDATLGIVAPVGSGTGGAFFSYKGVRSNFDGDTTLSGNAYSNSLGIGSRFNMQSDSDEFSMRFLYGQPISGDFKWGAELQFGYQQEKNDTSDSLSSVTLNGTQYLGNASLRGTNGIWGLLYPFMMPKDDNYWDVTVKTGVDGSFGPAKVGVTVRGGAFVGGDSKWKYSDVASVPSEPFDLSNRFDLNGSVDGWKLGGDLWVRVPYSSTVSLPFIVRVDYMDKNRDGSGIGTVASTTGLDSGILDFDAFSQSSAYNYSGKEKLLNIETGGGIDVQYSSTLKLAGGLYYNYISDKQSLSLTGNIADVNVLNMSVPVFVNFNYDGYPDRTEHLARFRFSAEQKYSPDLVLRGGLDVFGGFASESYAFYPSVNNATLLSNKGTLDGTHWGLIGSLGTSFKVQNVLVEPFVQAGYEELSLSDNSGSTSVLGVPLLPWSLDKDRNDVIVTTGVSVKF